MEEITISKELITEVTKDKTVISRVPGRRADYLYLKPEEIVAEDQYTIKAQINPDKLYVVGGKNPSQPGGLMRGNELLKNYVYETRYDPEQRTQVREPQERTRSAGKPVHRSHSNPSSRNSHSKGYRCSRSGHDQPKSRYIVSHNNPSSRCSHSKEMLHIHQISSGSCD